MSLESWLETVEVGQFLSLIGPEGLSGHDTSLDVALAQKAIIFRINGRQIDVGEYLSNTVGVDIVRVA